MTSEYTALSLQGAFAYTIGDAIRGAAEGSTVRLTDGSTVDRSVDGSVDDVCDILLCMWLHVWV